MANDLVVGIGFCYLVITWAIGIGAASWMVHMNNNGDWKRSIQNAVSGESAAADILFKSWQTNPFVDVAPTTNQWCPDDFPEDLIFDIWPGSRAMCNCLQREEDRDYFMDMHCRRGKNAEHNSEDCHDVGGLAPIVMNRFESVRYCAKRGSESLFDMVRPVAANTQSGYACPEGYLACNPDFFNQPDGADFVVCKEDVGSGSLDYCPITSVKFIVTEQERVQYDYVFKGDQQQGIWVSKKVMQHGIESIKVMPEQPCFDESFEYSSAPNQQFWFAEMRKIKRSCQKKGPLFREIESAPRLSEWDVHNESGVLNYLDQARDYTYSVWPGSIVKKDVKMKFFEKPVYNFKIQCETSEELTSMEDLRIEFSTDISSSSTWNDFLTSIENMAVTALCIILIVPIASGQGTVVCTPVTLLTIAGMFAALIAEGWKSQQELRDFSNSMAAPQWVNDCLDQELNLDLKYIDGQRAELLDVADSIESLSMLMIAYCCMVASMLMCFGTVVLGNLCCDGNHLKENFEYLSKEATHFVFKYYKEFN